MLHVKSTSVSKSSKIIVTDFCSVIQFVVIVFIKGHFFINCMCVDLICMNNFINVSPVYIANL